MHRVCKDLYQLSRDTSAGGSVGAWWLGKWKEPSYVIVAQIKKQNIKSSEVNRRLALFTRIRESQAQDATGCFCILLWYIFVIYFPSKNPNSCGYASRVHRESRETLFAGETLEEKSAQKSMHFRRVNGTGLFWPAECFGPDCPETGSEPDYRTFLK